MFRVSLSRRGPCLNEWMCRPSWNVELPDKKKVVRAGLYRLLIPSVCIAYSLTY
jgi:hypothetical protein